MLDRSLRARFVEASGLGTIPTHRRLGLVGQELFADAGSSKPCAQLSTIAMINTELQRIIDAATNGDDEARLSLFHLTYTELRRRAIPGMSDVVQGLALYLWRRHQRGLDNSAVYLAIAKALRRALINRARHEQRRQAVPLNDEDTVEQGSRQFTDLLQPEVRLRLEAAIDSLRTVNPAAAEVLLLKHHAGLPRATVARILGLSEGQVRRRLEDARKHLQEKLGVQFWDEMK